MRSVFQDCCRINAVILEVTDIEPDRLFWNASLCPQDLEVYINLYMISRQANGKRTKCSMGNLQSKILPKWLCFGSPDTTEPTVELSNNLTDTGSGESIQSDKFDETTQVIVHDTRTNRNYVKAIYDVESTWPLLKFVWHD
jgi:hypothetical protein